MVAVAGRPWRPEAPEVELTAFRLARPFASPRQSLTIGVVLRSVLTSIHLAGDELPAAVEAPLHIATELVKLIGLRAATAAS